MTNEEKIIEELCINGGCSSGRFKEPNKPCVGCGGRNCNAYDTAIKLMNWKDEQIRRYFSEHIVPSGDYNMELADDFIRYNEEKQKAIDEIIKTINEYE